MSIVPLLANASFDPETVETLSAAFDDAWEQIKQSGSTFARPAYERGAREVLANASSRWRNAASATRRCSATRR